MNVVFLSNYYNHHQAPFCCAMHKRLGDSFVFVQTKEMEAERISLGWGDEPEPVFLIKSYESSFAQKHCQDTIDKADVVIMGSAPELLIANRLKDGKLVLRYNERLFKKEEKIWKVPYLYYRLRKNNPKKANLYLLCAGAYTASDYARVGLFKKRCYKWGYFPEAKSYSDIERVIDTKDVGSVLWVARLIEWKHPEIPVLLAKHLKDEGYRFELNLIGNGVLENEMRNMIDSLDVSDCVKMLGAMKPWQVREYMERSQIFIFTSDRNEGWGAVLNEAMNSGCAVVASDAIGAVPYLIRDGENGEVYTDGDFESLVSKVKDLLNNPKKAALFGKKAYETIVNDWNAETAADRLMQLVEDLQRSKESDRYSQGPCSRA